MAPHSLSLVELVREVRNAKKATRFRELEYPLGDGEARTRLCCGKRNRYDRAACRGGKSKEVVAGKSS